MGYRAWLTEVESKEELKELVELVEAGELSYGAHHLAKSPEGDTLLCWSGDCTSSVEAAGPYVGRTIVLDNVDEEDRPNEKWSFFKLDDEEGLNRAFD